MRTTTTERSLMTLWQLLIIVTTLTNLFTEGDIQQLLAIWIIYFLNTLNYETH